MEGVTADSPVLARHGRPHYRCCACELVQTYIGDVLAEPGVIVIVFFKVLELENEEE